MLRTESLPQVVRYHVNGLTGRRRLRGGQQLAQFQISTFHSNLPSAAGTFSPSFHDIT
ncbi:hypothetical protein GCM10010340_49090 [Streptomyces griseoloalbus]|nr:hypothetical protein GCM10010340_49090 [Streptomyces albaduncus]